MTESDVDTALILRLTTDHKSSYAALKGLAGDVDAARQKRNAARRAVDELENAASEHQRRERGIPQDLQLRLASAKSNFDFANRSWEELANKRQAISQRAASQHDLLSNINAALIDQDIKLSLLEDYV